MSDFSFKSKECFWIALAFLAAFAYTYRASFHTPIVVDCGVLIDRSWRIFNGQVPGRDFYCPTTPMTYFIQALVFKIFSPKVFWMKVYLGLEMAVLTALAGLIAWKILGLSSKGLLLLVLPVTLVWAPGVHLMIPWYDVDAVFFSFVSLFFLGWAFRHPSKNESLRLFLAGLAGALSFLSKQNIGGGAAIAGFVFIFFQPFPLKDKARQYFWYGLGAALAISLLILYFVYQHAQKEAWDWMFVRAGQRYGEGNLLLAMWKSNLTALAGPRNNFLKFLLPIYLLAILLNFHRWNDRLEKGNVIFGASIYSFIAMWIGILQEGGMRYSTQQAFLGLVAGILIDTSGLYGHFKENTSLKKGLAAVLALALGAAFLWGLKIHLKPAGYRSSEISRTLDQPKMRGLYFRQEDCEIVRDLLEYEKQIPKNERIFLMPDPLFFYFAADRLSPVPLTHFYVSGWELNESEQKEIPGWLVKEDVKWVIIGKEEVFDTGFLRFGLNLDWRTAVLKNKAMTSRSDYGSLRDFIDKNYDSVPGPSGFWALRRKNFRRTR